MIIIGEKLNGAIPSVAEAIVKKDAGAIKALAIAQTDAGADYLDVCAGTEPDKEYETLVWMLEIVQAASDLPICIDSPDQDMLKRVLPAIGKPGIINSVSGEGSKCDVLYPLLRDNAGWQVVALTCDDSGIPSDAAKKAEIAFRLISKAGEYGISPGRIFIDPLVLSLSAVNDSMLSFMEAIRQIKAQHPAVKFTSGLSNISYGMPARKLINQGFLTLAISAGMDSAIMDPMNRGMMETVLAAEALLGKDKYCRKYNKAYREGRLGSKKI